MNWLRHAFAVDPPGPVEPTPSQRRVVDAVCREIVKRHLTTPVLLFLELGRPMNFVGAHCLHFFQPVLSLLKDARQIREFAYYLERRGSVEYICRRIEELERLAEGRERGEADQMHDHGDAETRRC